MVCKDGEIASKIISTTEAVNCVTISGDKHEKKGKICGGFIDDSKWAFLEQNSILNHQILWRSYELSFIEVIFETVDQIWNASLIKSIPRRYNWNACPWPQKMTVKTFSPSQEFQTQYDYRTLLHCPSKEIHKLSMLDHVN